MEYWNQQQNWPKMMGCGTAEDIQKRKRYWNLYVTVVLDLGTAWACKSSYRKGILPLSSGSTRSQQKEHHQSLTPRVHQKPRFFSYSFGNGRWVQCLLLMTNNIQITTWYSWKCYSAGRLRIKDNAHKIAEICTQRKLEIRSNIQCRWVWIIVDFQKKYPMHLKHSCVPASMNHLTNTL